MTEETKIILRLYRALNAEQKKILIDIITLASEQPERCKEVCKLVKRGVSIEKAMERG